MRRIWRKMSSLSWKCLLQKQSFQWVCSQTLTHLPLSPAQLCWLSGGSETKQTETAQLENCRNLLSESRMQPQTRIRIWFGVRRALPSPAPCSRGHCREGQRPVFVSSLPHTLLLAPVTPSRYVPFPSLSLPPTVSPFLHPLDSDHVSLW